MTALTHAVIRRRLFAVLIVYEAAIISVILAAGANIALAQGGTLAAAAPLIVIGLAESLRIPLAGWSVRLNFRGKLLAWVALIAIALASFDGLALVFSMFVDNRIANVLAAEHRVEIAKTGADQVAGDVASSTAEVQELDAEVAALAKSMPQAPTGSNRVCTWHGQRVSCSADATDAATYQAAMRAYDARLAELTSKRAGLQAKVDAARNKTAAPEELAAARRALDDELALSPMHRLAATVYGVRVADLTEDQFNVVKRWNEKAGGIALAPAPGSISSGITLRIKGDTGISAQCAGDLQRALTDIYPNPPSKIANNQQIDFLSSCPDCVQIEIDY